MKDEKSSQPQPTTFIGIDPASRKDGFGTFMFDSETRKAEATVFKFPEDFYAYIPVLHELHPNAIICIENSDLQGGASMYGYHERGFIADVKKYGQARALSIFLKKAMGVGKNQEVSNTVARMCIKYWGEDNVIQITPRQKGDVPDQKAVNTQIQIQRMEFDSEKDKPTKEDTRSAFACCLYGRANYKTRNRQTKTAIPEKTTKRKSWTSVDVDAIKNRKNKR
jgi:hypothetical protein